MAVFIANLYPAYLRLHGVNAREHPVFVELTRVKQYFDKIKRAENPVDQKPGMVIDKSAAHRFIRAGLVSLVAIHRSTQLTRSQAGNDKLDFEREERLKKEKAKVNIKFADHEAAEPKKAAAVKTASPSADSSDSSEEDEEVRVVTEAPKVVNKTATQKAKDRKVEVLASRSASQSKESTPSSEGRTSNAARKKKKQNKRKTHRKASEGK